MPNDSSRHTPDRMPAILDRQDLGKWLEHDGKDTTELEELLRPFPSARMRVFPVSTRVNSPRFDDPDCIRPVEEQGSLDF